MTLDLDENNTRMEAYLRRELKNINNKIDKSESMIDNLSNKIDVVNESEDVSNKEDIKIAKKNKDEIRNSIERYKDIRSYIETSILAERSLQEINEEYMDCLPEEVDNKELLLEKMKQIESQIEMAVDRDVLDEFDIYSDIYCDFVRRISLIERNF